MIEIKMPEDKEEVKGDLISRQAVIYYIKPYIQEIITESGVDKNERTNRILRAIINGIETMPTGRECRQEDAEDCISRQEALSHKHIVYDDDGIGYSVVRADVIEKLPTVTPKAKTGKWERYVNDYIKCSKCGALVKSYHSYKYCPKCGRKMEG